MAMTRSPSRVSSIRSDTLTSVMTLVAASETVLVEKIVVVFGTAFGTLVLANVFVNARFPVVATCVKVSVELHGTVFASRYWNGVVLVEVPPPGMFGYDDV